MTIVTVTWTPVVFSDDESPYGRPNDRSEAFKISLKLNFHFQRPRPNLKGAADDGPKQTDKSVYQLDKGAC